MRPCLKSRVWIVGIFQHLCQKLLHRRLTERSLEQVHDLVVGQRLRVPEKTLQHPRPCAQAVCPFPARQLADLSGDYLLVVFRISQLALCLFHALPQLGDLCEVIHAGPPLPVVGPPTAAVPSGLLRSHSSAGSWEADSGPCARWRSQVSAWIRFCRGYSFLTYQQIDPEGNLHFSSLFTLKNEVYSGSEATVFHFVKLFALQAILMHDFPIVIDSFRAEDLSTSKENIALGIAKGISNQVILTTTLKKEEQGKYDKVKGLNHIDYREHAPSKILNGRYVKEFSELLSGLSLEIKRG